MMVRALRDDLEMNQLEFANEIGVTRETVSRWETGKYSMTPKNMNLIENYIDQKITKQVTT
jgi:DNA-binding transcriptional regulator YiaG